VKVLLHRNKEYTASKGRPQDSRRPEGLHSQTGHRLLRTCRHQEKDLSDGQSRA